MTAQGSALTRLRRALAGGDLLAARMAASDLPHVDLEEAAALLVLIASEDPEKLDAAAVRFLGALCLERSFTTLHDAARIRQMTDEIAPLSGPGLQAL